MKFDLNREKFEQRHVGPNEDQLNKMIQTIGVSSLDQLINEAVPETIRLKKPLDLPKAKSEYNFIKDFKQLGKKNKIFKSYLGCGYYDTITPPVILRNILENPGWYTAYTPYQAEIAQGRLEALINFQTMVVDLTGMELANASLLDEGTAAAEAMTMLHNLRKADKKGANTFLVSENCFPQTLDILKTRAIPLGIKLHIGDINPIDFNNPDVFGVYVQYPNAWGLIYSQKDFIAAAHAKNVLVAIGTDLLSLTLLTPPGEMGADVVVGSSQRFGVPMGYGGPHAAFFATKEEYKRNIPGRVIGISVDSNGDKAYRMALQTREQHIRREKATSNICTAQVLLAVIAGSYAVYHGPKGLRAIGERVHGMAKLLCKSLELIGYRQYNKNFFDTIKIAVDKNKDQIKLLSERAGMNFRFLDSYAVISVDETTDLEDIKKIIAVFAEASSKTYDKPFEEALNSIEVTYPEELRRKSEYLTHPVFNSFHAEHQMLRYLKHLENKDLSLVHSMISLGSCTMKLNATSEMIPVTWPEFGGIHPFAPKEQAEGYQLLFKDLEKWLCEITGFAAVSLQPNSGAQGEYAGLLVIRSFHISKGQGHRNVALIPSSAHGTNPASAVMVGMNVVVVKCDEKGNVEMKDLREKALAHKDNLSCLMVTYPSTHGVFEESIKEICQIIHENGGQVYMDGANMNAQVGLTSPATIGADVCHLNLHKTFCIPHGGGGPGMGPIGVAAHLVKHLPGHAVVKVAEKETGAVSAAPWGSASILPISYAYIAMMGGEGLTNATKYAILNANYIKARLEKYYPILFSGSKGRCAHEFILDCRNFKHTVGIEVEDIAKRLMDYGFHAPTVSFPVPGTMMIEPTESEPMEELDRFCEAMISIRNEIKEIESGKADKVNNVLKNAPHTAKVALSDDWDKPYTREKAVYPLHWVRATKFWPTVGRIDNAYGDRNLVCSCVPMEEYEEIVS